MKLSAHSKGDISGKGRSNEEEHEAYDYVKNSN